MLGGSGPRALLLPRLTRLHLAQWQSGGWACLSSPSALTSLEVKNAVPESGLGLLANMARRLSTLKLGKLLMIDPVVFGSCIPRLTALTSLTLRDSFNIYGRPLHALLKLPALAHLSLTNVACQDLDCAVFASLSRLTSLVLRYCDNISSAAIVYLSTAPSLQSITIERCFNVQRRDVEETLRAVGRTSLALHFSDATAGRYASAWSDVTLDEHEGGGGGLDVMDPGSMTESMSGDDDEAWA